jgi:hypothetical protein
VASRPTGLGGTLGPEILPRSPRLQWGNRNFPVFKEVLNRLIDKFATKLAIAIAERLGPAIDEMLEERLGEAREMMGNQLDKAEQILDKKIEMIEAVIKDPRAIKKLLGFP